MNNLFLLLPELILFVFAFIIFTMDLIWNKRGGSQSAFPILAMVGSLLAFAATLYLWFGGTFAIIATDSSQQIPMLAADQFSFFFKVYTTLTLAFVTLIATTYVKNRINFQGEFYALMLMAGLSVMLVAASTNLIMIFLAFEFLSITSYLLTGYMREDSNSIEGAVKYFLYGSVASAVMLYGFSLIYGATGSVDLQGIAQGLAVADESIIDFLVTPAIVLVLVGLGFKIALVPFHQWSPEAYQGAPTPVTAFLSVGPKAAGFALLVRIMIIAFPEFAESIATNWILILTIIAMLTMTFGNVVALWQRDVKRLFAYSSIAQAGYMLIGLVAIAPEYLVNGQFNGNGWTQGLNGILLYLLAYLFTNIGAFAIIIAVENESGSSHLDHYKGLFKRSPMMAIAFLIFLLSLIGIPPTAGFMGKLFVFGAALEQGMYVLSAVAIINSVISVYYYFTVGRYMFFDDPEEGHSQPISMGGSLGATIAITAVLVLAVFIFAQPFINFTANSAQLLAGL